VRAAPGLTVSLIDCTLTLELNYNDGSGVPVATIDGVHHVKLPVSDVGRSRAWYERVLGFELVTWPAPGPRATPQRVRDGLPDSGLKR
jgi:catechol-2,3-dioxygenase